MIIGLVNCQSLQVRNFRVFVQQKYQSFAVSQGVKRKSFRLKAIVNNFSGKLLVKQVRVLASIGYFIFMGALTFKIIKQSRTKQISCTNAVSRFAEVTSAKLLFWWQPQTYMNLQYFNDTFTSCDIDISLLCERYPLLQMSLYC